MKGARKMREDEVVIHYAVGQCSLGPILVAASDVGICSITLGDHPDELLRALHKQFPHMELVSGDRKFEKMVAKVIAFVESPATEIDLPLDIQGTKFQQRVWKKLAQIPHGETRTYAQIAKS